MPRPEDWFYERLSSEPVREERDRWTSIVSRLRRLTGASDSPNRRTDADVDAAEHERKEAHRDRLEQERRDGPETSSGEAPIATHLAVRQAGAESELMTSGEHRLVSLAAALIANSAALSTAETKLARRAQIVDARVVAHARAKILSGDDVLGTTFCSLRSAQQRRQYGATYTPARIIDAMMAWAREEISKHARVVDVGAGSGRFLIAAARHFPKAALIGVEIDPVAALMLRANAAVHGFADRLTVYLIDYRILSLPPTAGATLFIGNPPYVRHHQIGGQWKSWFAATAKRFGLTASKLAGLHVHFFLKTREIARPGDYGAFVTAAEWLDVNYGGLLRRMLTDGLGGVAVDLIDPKAQPFADALTTAAITCFRVGARPTAIRMRSVTSLDELSPLGCGRPVPTAEVGSARKWSVFVDGSERTAAGAIELGDLFRVHRGQVTGGNEVWIDNEAACHLPRRYKPFAVTSARQLFSAGAALISTRGLRRVIDLPVDLDGLEPEEREAVHRFLAWAKRQGAHESYIARHRRAWWSVGLRAPAPILCTYMARRPPTFVRNRVNARHINIAHGLYPRERMSEADLTAIAQYLRRHIGLRDGRTYAGRLVKYEPKELERILLPRIDEIHGYLAETEPPTPAMDVSKRSPMPCSRPHGSAWMQRAPRVFAIRC